MTQACADVGSLLAKAVQVDGREATASRYSWILIAVIIVAARVKTEEEVELVEVPSHPRQVQYGLPRAPWRRMSARNNPPNLVKFTLHAAGCCERE